MAGADLADAVQEVRRMAALLQQFKERPGAPLFRTRVQAVRQRLDGECRQRFARAVAAEFLPAVQQAAAGGAADTGPLEQTARHLRELEMEARAFGGGDAYDTQLRSAAAAVRNSTAGMSDAARVRLVEILAGPEAAMALLESLSRGGGM